FVRTNTGTGPCSFLTKPQRPRRASCRASSLTTNPSSVAPFTIPMASAGVFDSMTSSPQAESASRRALLRLPSSWTTRTFFSIQLDVILGRMGDGRNVRSIGDSRRIDRLKAYLHLRRQSVEREHRSSAERVHHDSESLADVRQRVANPPLYGSSDSTCDGLG